MLRTLYLVALRVIIDTSYTFFHIISPEIWQLSGITGDLICPTHFLINQTSWHIDNSRSLTTSIPLFNLILMPLAANKPSVSSVRSKCKKNCAHISTSQAKNLGKDEIQISGQLWHLSRLTHKLSEILPVQFCNSLLLPLKWKTGLWAVVI